jgi:hypothetical protein
MADSENVAPFQKRRDPRWEEIRNRLINSGPLEKAEPPVLASNLGRMAERLDHSRPKSAARRMFQEAFGEHWEDLWRKRKRLVRLPGDASPPFERYGEYEARGAKYVRLAEAFAKLRGVDADDGDAAIRSLTRGTSLNPEQLPSPSELEGVERILNDLKAVTKRIQSAEMLSRAFEILRSHPISNDEGTISLELRNSPALTDNYINNKLGLIDRDLHWSIPRVQIGHIYIPLNTACVKIGHIESIANAVDSSDLVRARLEVEEAIRYGESAAAGDMEAEISERALLSRALKSLRKRIEVLDLAIDPFRELVFEPGNFDRIAQYEATEELRHYDTMTKYDISLCIWPSSPNGALDIRVVFTNDKGALPFPQYFIKLDDELIDIFGSERLGEVEDGELKCTVIVFDDHAYAVASFNVLFCMMLTKQFSYIGIHALDTDESSEILLMGFDDEIIFQPIIWDDRNRFAPAPQVSMVATILRNLRYANDEDRLDKLLLADAERRLRPVVQFYEAQRAAFDEAMDQRD